MTAPRPAAASWPCPPWGMKPLTSAARVVRLLAGGAPGGTLLTTRVPESEAMTSQIYFCLSKLETVEMLNTGNLQSTVKQRHKDVWKYRSYWFCVYIYKVTLNLNEGNRLFKVIRWTETVCRTCSPFIICRPVLIRHGHLLHSLPMIDYWLRPYLPPEQHLEHHSGFVTRCWELIWWLGNNNDCNINNNNNNNINTDNNDNNKS